MFVEYSTDAIGSCRFESLVSNSLSYLSLDEFELDEIIEFIIGGLGDNGRSSIGSILSPSLASFNIVLMRRFFSSSSFFRNSMISSNCLNLSRSAFLNVGMVSDVNTPISLIIGISVIKLMFGKLPYFKIDYKN